MGRRPQDTTAEEPDGGNPHIRFRRGPERGNPPGLLNSKREYRRFTADQKIEILREADQPGVTVSEVCRRHGLSPSVLYRWRAVAQGGSAVALKRDAQRAPRKDDAETRHKAEMDRMRAVIAEITAENLELKKRI
jgi:transposase-like protein